MTHLVLLLTLHADADDLRDAARKTAEQPGFSFTVKDGPGKPLTGAWQKGKPLSVLADGVPFMRKGDVLVYKDAGKWQKTRTGTLSDPLRILGPSARVRTLVPPNEELARLAKAAKDVKKEKGGYTVTLTEEASKAWVPPSERGVAKGGTVRVRVAGGMVTGYEVKVRLSGKRGDAEVKGEMTRTVELKDVGKAKVDVPAEAGKLLE
jgi:hypothetical protein